VIFEAIIKTFVERKTREWDERIKSKDKEWAAEAYIEYCIIKRTIDWDTQQDIMSLRTS
jgi:hypothetical protein